MSSTPRRALCCLLLLVAASGCEYHEPEPLSKTVPFGVTVFAATMAGLWWLARRTVGQLDLSAAPSPSELVPLRFPRTVVALLVGPPVAALVLLSALVGHAVAFAYQDGETSPLSWSDTASAAVIIGTVGLAVVAASAHLAIGVVSRDRSTRFRARAFVLVFTALLSLGGFGLAWVPAAIAMFIQAPDQRTCAPCPA